MATKLVCPLPECEYSTGDQTEPVAIAYLNAHMYAHKSPPAQQQSAASIGHRGGPKLDRPTIETGVSMEEWIMFTRRWNIFREGSQIADNSASHHLFQCADAALGDSLLKTDPDIIKKDIDTLLSTMKKLAVIPIATGIIRSELLEMKQLRDETFRKFASRVRGKAETCEYETSVVCQCRRVNSVDFTDHIMRDVLLAGIYDADIRREMYGIDKVLKQPINDVISIVEKKEMARDALSAASASSMSSMKLQRKKGHAGAEASGHQQKSNVSERSKQGSCPHCKKDYALYKEGRFGWNSKPYDMCPGCFRAQRRKKPETTTVSSVSEPEADVGVIVAHVSTIAEAEAGTCDAMGKQQTNRKRNHTEGKYLQSVRMDHHIFTEGEWRRSKFLEHPTWSARISVNRKDYSAFSRPCPKVANFNVSAKLDSCAQSCLWSKKEFLSAGFKEEDLIPVSLALKAANKSSIEISGAILVRIEAEINKEKHHCATMVYISPSCDGFYLSLEAMLDLNLLQTLTHGGPINAACDVTTESTIDANVETAKTPPHPTMSSDEPCACPVRKAPPVRPDNLPFPATPENNEKMEKWLLEEFASSTFNKCPRQHLPEMSGPPVEIHLKDGAVPYKAQTAVSVPLHWQADVREQLKRDEKGLGVLERPPPDEDSEWCFREVYTAKTNSEPRRTVDYRLLNKWVKRDAFATESPFHIARRIPGHSWKTVSDAWNGYHSVPLHPNSRHLTTFITMEGKFRYTRTPQGASFAGDAYNRRHATITAEFPCKENIVDDPCHYDQIDELEQHWWRTIDYLILCGQNGIILNPEKFQFARLTVDFAGFRITESSIEPLPKYLDAIRDFPTPKSITDIRSWFGLVNQLANYAQLRDLMRPFKAFLSPKTPFIWNEELQGCFEISKAAIIDLIKQGVAIFDLDRVTCLRTDWSSNGTGYYLSQKHCDCPSNLPGCCENGWQVTLAGSRFLVGAEQRYVAIEGEALSVAWALEQTKYFTLGCKNLIVATDHKPLVAILGDKELNQISNPRIFRLKQRTLPWCFDIAYLPGQTNGVADAMSRNPTQKCEEPVIENSVNVAMLGAKPLSHHPSPNGGLSEGDRAEIAMLRHTTECTALLWSDITAECAADSTISTLATTVKQGFPATRGELNDALAPYWNIRKSLVVSDGNVVWYNDRVVLPHTLRLKALEILHSAHQGVSGMEDRARNIVYWPGITKDIQEKRDGCSICCKNAPSQASLPAMIPDIPSTPFESVFADFFQEEGYHFLVAGDRLSGWVEAYSSPVGSAKAGSKGLIAHLRTMFATFGVPEILSSDGGPEFISTATEDFLTRWGVKHRQSSAYHPQSNGRAEVAVKKAKRLLKSCIDSRGGLNNDRFLRGMLQLRNTPDPESKMSPAQVLFGKPLRDAFSFVNRCPKYENPSIRPTWHDAWASKEDALRTRFAISMEKLNAHARQLPQLEIGERVFIQNQNGPHPNKWDRSGVVLESLGHDQYTIKVDGSGRLTKRNRRFLRHYTLPGRPIVKNSAPSAHVPLQVHALPQLNMSPPQQSVENASPYAQMPQQSLSVPQVHTPPTQQSSDQTLAHTHKPQIQMEQQPPYTATTEESATPRPATSILLPTSQPAAAKKPRGRPPKVRGFRGICGPGMVKQTRAHSAQDDLAYADGDSAQTTRPAMPVSVTSPSRPSTAGETSSSAPSRPTRDKCPPKKYDAASGKWI